MDSAVKVSDAAKLVNKDRKTIYNGYLKTGKLPHHINSLGIKMIYLYDLERVFGHLSFPVDDKPVYVDDKTDYENEKLKIKIEVLESMLLDALKGV